MTIRHCVCFTKIISGSFFTDALISIMFQLKEIKTNRHILQFWAQQGIRDGQWQHVAD